MKSITIRIWMISLVLVMSTLACGLGSKKSPENPSAQNKTEKPGEADIQLGEEYISQGGGFSLRKIDGYNFNDVIGIVNMIAPDGSQEVGPGIMVVGGVADKEYTNEEMFGKMETESTAIKTSHKKNIKVDGVSGLMAEMSGKYDDQEIKGKIVVVMVTPTQQFLMIATAPEPRWEELEPLFEAVLRSVEFFAPDPDAMLDTLDTAGEDTPTANDTPQESGGLIRQWASFATASTEYGDFDWSSTQATGAPDVDECGDNAKAWASQSPNTLDWLELTYETPVVPTEINIYQSYNPSQVVEVQGIDLDGYTYTLWSGNVKTVADCPDLMTITIDLQEEIVINKVVVIVDQSQWGSWDEIDAVELVGYAQGGPVSSNPSSSSGSSGSEVSNADVPDNYEGWMAKNPYQGYASVVINETKESELTGLLGSAGKKSTENWKPRPDHADTYLWDIGNDYKIFISVTTDGIVYKKSISPYFVPDGFELDTVNDDSYQELKDIYSRSLAIPYPVMANLLESPGFLREAYEVDGVIKENYEWYDSNGGRITGFFVDGQLTGIAGLAYIKE
jgi:hypothetical protein